MAHVGKFYPLAFRRDLWLGRSTGRQGFPKYFRCYGAELVGTVGLAFAARPFDYIGDVGPDRPLNLWDSGFRGAEGYRFRVEYELTQLVESTSYRFRLRISEEEEGLLFQSLEENPFAGGGGAYHVHFLGGWFPKPEIFRPETLLSSCFLRPQLWSEL